MRDAKTLSPKEYLARFALAARWYLGEKEAPAAVADYEELMACEEDAQRTPVQRFGTPLYAASLLLVEWRYRTWLAAFAAMSACAVWLLLGIFSNNRLLFNWIEMWNLEVNVCAIVLLGAGVALSMFYFPGGQAKETQQPLRPVLRVLAVMLCAGAVAAAVLAGVLRAFVQGKVELRDIERVHHGLRIFMDCTGVAFALTAIGGLAAARCLGRRWRAVYVLALALLAMLVTLRMYLTMCSDLDAFYAAVTEGELAILLAGLVGTGVALC